MLLEKSESAFLVASRSAFVRPSLWIHYGFVLPPQQTYLKLTPPYTKKEHIQIGVTWVQEGILNEQEHCRNEKIRCVTTLAMSFAARLRGIHEACMNVCRAAADKNTLALLCNVFGLRYLCKA